MKRNSIWSHEIPVRQIVAALRSHLFTVIISFGVLFRVAAYLANRSFWMDEASLADCIKHLDQSGLFGPLGSTQLAPPGFLAAEWLVTRISDTSPLAFRLVPLVAGIIGLFLFQRIAHACLKNQAAELVAMTLFAVTDDVIYFAAEAKQYSSDMAFTFAILAGALRLNGRGPGNWRAILRWGLAGSSVVWFSHPAIFTLATIGVVILTNLVRSGEWKQACIWVGIVLTWVASFVLVHEVAMNQLGHRHDMWVFWDFAFPTLPLRSAWDVAWPVRRFLFLFASPLNFDAPCGARWSIWPAVALTIAGSVRLLRSAPTPLAMTTLPGGFALLAAYARLYPFHGRLLLFWVPLLLIPLAAGLNAVKWKPLRWFLVAWVVAVPIGNALYRVLEPRQRDQPNPYGDRRPSNLNPYWFPLAEPRTPSRSSGPSRE